MKKFFIIFLSIFCFGFDLDDLRNELKNDQINGDFNATKFIKDMNINFKSSGKFELKNEELLWKTTAPVEIFLKINKDGIFQLQNENWIKSENSFDKNLMIAIFNLNFEELKKEFDINLAGNKKNWEINLIPKNLLFKQIFKQISIFGDEKIKKILVLEANGDETLNEFFNVK